MTFRDLRADEVECRVALVKEKGVQLLLYKDARCDMNVLDETVGAENWQRSHDVVNGNLFCKVGIRVGDEWVWKQDVGVESYTEKEKGQASDSFKRACVNWGIGRELYTAPFIWIKTEDCKIEQGKDGKLRCRDSFDVADLVVSEKKIVKLTIKNKGRVVYRYNDAKLTPAQIDILETCIPKHNQTVDSVCKFYNVKSLSDLTNTQFVVLMDRMGEDV